MWLGASNCFTQYDHPIALTVEAQDKKHRFYVVSALADTKVDLKVLPQRLGLGKAGLRMAPEEALPEILQVPLGCVTPFALVNDSARHVLLMDKGFKGQECCFFHPLLNDTSISLRVHNLDKFLKSIGKDPTYASPSVRKDQPPDIAAFVPSDAIVLQEDPEKAAPPQVPEKKIVAANNESTTVTAKAGNQSNDTQKEKSANVKLSSSFTNPEKFIEEILERTSTIVLSEVSRVYAICNFKASSGLGLRKQTIQIKEETIKQHGEQLGTLVSNSIRKHLSLDFINLATVLKNTAYTEGFHAGTHHQGSRFP
ncbi:hypothetical protein ACSBR2_029882 [Camellia fascicularis]